MQKYTLIVSEEQRRLLEEALESAPTPEVDVDECELLLGMIADARPHEQPGDFPVINDCTL